MNKHLQILTQFPDEYFSSFKHVMRYIKSKIAQKQHVKETEIARCYYGLANAMNPQTPGVSLVNDYISDYRFLDSINPRKNHFYERVYKRDFSLPKMYKTVFANKKPLNRTLILKPNVQNW